MAQPDVIKPLMASQTLSSRFPDVSICGTACPIRGGLWWPDVANLWAGVVKPWAGVVSPWAGVVEIRASGCAF